MRVNNAAWVTDDGSEGAVFQSFSSLLVCITRYRQVVGQFRVAGGGGPVRLPYAMVTLQGLRSRGGACVGNTLKLPFLASQPFPVQQI